MGSTIPNVGRSRKRISLADALFSRTQQRVLGLLFGQPDRTWFTTEIMKRTRSGSGAVQRELARLADSGLVTVSRQGNQKHYRASPDSPLFHELRNIFLKTTGLAEPIRAALESLGDRIKVAFIYGSVARGEDRAESDIDILIVADDVTLEEIFARLSTVERRLGRKISPRLYTSDEFRRRRRSHNPFLKKVLAGERIMLIGSEDASDPSR